MNLSDIILSRISSNMRLENITKYADNRIKSYKNAGISFKTNKKRNILINILIFHNF